MNLRDQILEKLSDKEYRDAYVEEFIFSRIPLKIRAMRDDREMSQTELGRKAGIAQPWVSKLEDPNYGRLTISTLLRVASAFDVGLYVDFVPFSEILGQSTSLSPDSFQVKSFDDEVKSGCFEAPSVDAYELTPAKQKKNKTEKKETDKEQKSKSKVLNIGDFMSGEAQRVASLGSVPTERGSQGVLSLPQATGGDGNETLVSRAS
ncbi:MAG: helix-turn-helix domain-containing protein [Nitrososphaerales archaeon]